jgi:hypothetical protein
VRQNRKVFYLIILFRIKIILSEIDVLNDRKGRRRVLSGQSIHLRLFRGMLASFAMLSSSSLGPLQSICSSRFTLSNRKDFEIGLDYIMQSYFIAYTYVR